MQTVSFDLDQKTKSGFHLAVWWRIDRTFYVVQDQEGLIIKILFLFGVLKYFLLASLAVKGVGLTVSRLLGWKRESLQRFCQISPGSSSPDPAECFLCNAEIGCYGTKWCALQYTGLGFVELPVAFFCT